MRKPELVELLHQHRVVNLQFVCTERAVGNYLRGWRMNVDKNIDIGDVKPLIADNEELNDLGSLKFKITAIVRVDVNLTCTPNKMERCISFSLNGLSQSISSHAIDHENWNDTEFKTTLLDACIGGDLARVKFILSDGRADINSVGKDNMTPVMHAAKEGHREVFDLLVREGANLSLLDDEDKNIAHLACIGGSVEIVKYVFTQNVVGINSRDLDGLTPAMTAALYKRKDVFDLLVEAGADLLLLNEFGETILHRACEGVMCR
ncbi:probable palmitoyltransferase AKR2 [Haliotis rubra]|uniref:probable palmitoyltransferase AKR2 n=1 Tax=Haliotis rubra TaxID=36100 RepID=UPI001EE5E632|nr:probable palmitoyltransferase AKR2 [Haliotis rubra]